MSTGLQIITDGLIGAGVAGNGDPISANDSSFALRTFNRMMDSWNNENLMVYSLTSQQFTMTAGQQTYTSALLSNGRPIGVDSLIVSLNNIDYEVDIISTEEFQAIPYKPVNSIPEVMALTQAFPVMSFDFWPRPYAAFTCTMQVLTLLPDTITESTVIALPPSYEEALVSNLSVKYAKQWGRPVTQDMVNSARHGRAIIKRRNYTPELLQTGLGGTAGQISNGFIYQGWR